MSVNVLLTLAIGLAYTFILGLILRTRGWKEWPLMWLLVLCLGGGAWAFTQATALLGWWSALPVATLPLIALYVAFALTLVFLQLTRAFLRLNDPGWVWWAAGLAWLAVGVALGSGLVSGLPAFLVQSLFISGLLLVGWGLLLGLATILTGRTYGQTRNPLHRNRLKYWIPVILLMLAGGALRFIGYAPLGAGLEVSGAGLAAYVLLVHRPPDVRRAVRLILNYLTGALFAIGVYAALFSLGYWIFQSQPGYAVGYMPLAFVLGAGLLVVIAVNPMLGWVRGRVSQFIEGVGYDPNKALREYSLSISNILDIERLAALVVGLTRDALGSRHGALFLVDKAESAEGETIFHLWRVGHESGNNVSASGPLPATNPVAVYFSQERRALTQYDIDLLPQFRATKTNPHGWLANQHMDVYVPIYAKNEWSGLLALGPKTSGDRYFDDDLLLLGALADQTAVALENARLVSDLRQLNLQLERANTALEKANLDLQELDKLKSAFIGVITHELRTPFANIVFSIQLLQRHGIEHLSPQQLEQLVELSQQVGMLKKMVDNLVTFATFLSKQGHLKREALEFGRVVTEAVAPLATLAAGKGYTMHQNIEEHLPTLRGDNERLTEAIQHLVQNAIKFNKPNGEIWVNVWATPTHVHLEVKDSGLGVPADKVAGLWDAFAQMADPLKRGAAGLGLGLALVKYVATEHGGEVTATSADGIGSAFGFSLPINN